ncbi:MAG: hypothetical protein H3C62_16790 [Gemmatimonadaceae bacterium]|nr:hypothetical protein [Gemmatimonadaceae bacterium]
MKNKISDLRNHLFETLEALKDEDKPMEIERATAIANVARVIVDSAKAEVQFLSVLERDPTLRSIGSGFLGQGDEAPPAPRRLGAV